jgi:competence protein ComGC
MNKQKGYTLVELILVPVYLVLIIGWVLNIVKVVHAIHNPLDGMEVLRMVGIVVAPLGGVLGWM